MVVSEFTRGQHRQYDEHFVDTVRYLTIGMWVQLDPERAPEGVDDAGWLWARIRSSMELDEVTFGWVHPKIFRQFQSFSVRGAGASQPRIKIFKGLLGHGLGALALRHHI